MTDEPQQPRPGTTAEMQAKPDHGEDSHVGPGLRKGETALLRVATS
jgi:hypothetical protein